MGIRNFGHGLPSRARLTEEANIELKGCFYSTKLKNLPRKDIIVKFSRKCINIFRTLAQNSLLVLEKK